VVACVLGRGGRVFKKKGVMVLVGKNQWGRVSIQHGNINSWPDGNVKNQQQRAACKKNITA